MAKAGGRCQPWEPTGGPLEGVDRDTNWEPLAGVDQAVYWEPLADVDQAADWEPLADIDWATNWQPLVDVDRATNWKPLAAVDQAAYWDPPADVDRAANNGAGTVGKLGTGECWQLGDSFSPLHIQTAKLHIDKAAASWSAIQYMEKCFCLE